MFSNWLCSAPSADDKDAACEAEFVFVVNRRTPRAIVDVAIAAQSAGFGSIVFEHDAVTERVGDAFFADAGEPPCLALLVSNERLV